jgi:hypothetical protein
MRKTGFYRDIPPVGLGAGSSWVVAMCLTASSSRCASKPDKLRTSTAINGRGRTWGAFRYSSLAPPTTIAPIAAALKKGPRLPSPRPCGERVGGRGPRGQQLVAVAARANHLRRGRSAPLFVGARDSLSVEIFHQPRRSSGALAPEPVRAAVTGRRVTGVGGAAKTLALRCWTPGPGSTCISLHGRLSRGHAHSWLAPSGASDADHSRCRHMLPDARASHREDGARLVFSGSPTSISSNRVWTPQDVGGAAIARSRGGPRPRSPPPFTAAALQASAPATSSGRSRPLLLRTSG